MLIGLSSLAQHWENGCRHYVVATLPQLESFDGKAISKSERLLALQRLPALEHELSQLAPKAVARKAEQRRRRAAKQAERAARGEEESAGDDVDEYCPEVRVADAREAREQREAQEAAKEGTRRGGPGDAPLFGDQMGGERRFFKAGHAVLGRQSPPDPHCRRVGHRRTARRPSR